LEVGVGFVGRRTAGFALLSLAFTEGDYYRGDRDGLTRAGAVLDRSASFVFLGGGAERSFSEGSTWCWGGAAGLGAFRTSLNVPDRIEVAGEKHETGFGVQGMLWIGPRWHETIGPLGVGLRLRTSVAIGREAAFIGLALLGGVAYP
jgi:hypothetical protein